MGSITSANSTFLLAIDGLFPVPQQLQGFSADDVFTTDPQEVAETSMGVDGVLSAGFVFVPTKQSITLQADSPSNEMFDQWRAAQQLIRDLYEASGLVILPSLGKKWTLTKGFITTWPPMPDAAKTLRPRKFGITWEQVSSAPI